MSGSSDISLAQQRTLLRQELLAQRLLINHQLEVPPDSVAAVGPRSVTMQLLRSRPELVLRLLARTVSLLRKGGARRGNARWGLLAIPLLLLLVSVTARKLSQARED
jgi:hypothetical protein